MKDSDWKHRINTGLRLALVGGLLNACNGGAAQPTSVAATYEPTNISGGPRPIPSTEAPTFTPSIVPFPTPTIEATAAPLPDLPVPDKERDPFSFLQQFGVNLAGAEFGKRPGKLNEDYIYPGEKEFAEWALKGVHLIRYPVGIERLVTYDKVTGAAVLTDDIKYLKEAFDSAARHNQQVILDAHNYGRITENGVDRFITQKEMADFWDLMSLTFKNHPGVLAYGLMNEPHDMPSSGDSTWPKLAQAGINAIRKNDQSTLILIGGENWSNTQSWEDVNDKLATQLQDPTGNYAFEAHTYMDNDFSGQFKCGTAEQCGATPDRADERLQPFLDWCKENKVHGFIGETGFPSDDAGWKPVYERELKLLKENNMGATLWAAGPWWGGYNLSLENPHAQWMIDKLGDNTK